MEEAIRQFLIEGERAGMRYSLGTPRSNTAPTTGLQLGQRAGSSLEFREHRDYQAGDDLRRIDWNAYARSDKLTIKLFREEISPHLDLILDGSRSMNLEGSAKLQVSTGLAAVLAIAAENAGYTHKTWLLRSWCEPVANSGNRPSHWDNLEFDYRENPVEGFTRVPPKFRRQGMRALISDLLWLGEPNRVLQQLSQEASSVFVVQVLAAADVNPPERGRVRLVDSETDEEREIFIDDKAIKRYREALARHQQNWIRACRQAGAVLIEFVSEKLVPEWDLAELVKIGILKI
jgi:uncharacterized protein (DUF58 family)